MKRTRRSFLEKASALSALAVGASGVASAADCSGVPQWDETTLYYTGDRVTHPDSGGTETLWEAALDSRNAEPSSSSAYWDEVGPCDGSGGGGNTAPTASASASPTTVNTGDSVSFDGSGSGDSDGSISSYDWDFGDGTTGSGATTSHSYSSTGDYTATLTVTDDDGATDSDSVTITVESDSGGNSAPTASIDASPTTANTGESVSFDGSGSSDSDGSISSYDWDFGDGATASGQTTSHSYGSTGDYTVTLTVTDDDGATDTATVTISVESDSGGSGSAVFAPYDHMTTRPDTSIVDHANGAGHDAVTAAFVLSDGNANAAWDGAADMHVGEAGLASEIQAYQDQGGTVIISFGGAVGTMIAQDTTDVGKIESEYQSVIDTYGVNHLDFDIESVDEEAVDRRNQALANLQSANPNLKVSYTLRCRTTGLTSHGKYVVENAKSHGVDVQFVNVMTMNYGWVEPSASTVKDSANGTHSDLSSIYPNKSSSEVWGMVGLTPMIGQNNVGGAHHLDDAQEVADFVQNQGVGLVSFWSIDRDNGGCPDGSVSGTCSGIAQDLYEFASIYGQVQ